MTMKSELRVQAATQTVFATGLTPTITLRGLTSFKVGSANDVGVLKDMALGLAGGDTAILRKVGGKGSYEGWGTYEHICYWLDNLLGQATPSGAGPYVRAYAAPIASAPTPRILSLVHGDATVGAYQLIGALQNTMNFKQDVGKELMISGELIGYGLVPDALETLAIPVVNAITSEHLSAIKMDPWAGTMGATTLAACTVRAFDLGVKPERTARNCFGTINAQSYVEDVWDGDLKMTLEFNAASKAVIDSAIAAKTQRQLEWTYTDGARVLKFQFAGTIQDDIEVFDDDDGVVSVMFSVKRTYHATFANWLKIVATNAVAALT